MARYTVLQTSFINNRIYNEGDEVEYSGHPGANLQAIDKPAQKAASAQLPSDVSKLVGMVRIHAASRGVNPDEVNNTDVDVVVSSMDPAPDKATLDRALVALGLGPASLA